MLPQTTLNDRGKAHESINDLTVHKATVSQIFHPVSESRHFTRADAGEVFQRGLLPAEKRIPHPQLVAIAQVPSSDTSPRDHLNQQWELANQRDAEKEALARSKKEQQERATTVVSSGRWDFKFRDVKVDKESVGRHVPGIGARYGVPAQDRKKGQVKIPTRVE